jgi:hypothetical protein
VFISGQSLFWSVFISGPFPVNVNFWSVFISGQSLFLVRFVPKYCLYDHQVRCFLVKNDNFFSVFSGKNIFKIITRVPDFRSCSPAAVHQGHQPVGLHQRVGQLPPGRECRRVSGHALGGIRLCHLEVSIGSKNKTVLTQSKAAVSE